MNKMLTRGFFRLARNTLSYSDCKIRVGAVISRKSPISVGFNVTKTHPSFCNPEIGCTMSIHAEMNALMRANFVVKGCDVYIYRELADGTPGLAKPCIMCYNVLKSKGIKRIYYTTSRPPYWRMERL